MTIEEIKSQLDRLSEWYNILESVKRTAFSICSEILDLNMDLAIDGIYVNLQTLCIEFENGDNIDIVAPYNGRTHPIVYCGDYLYGSHSKNLPDEYREIANRHCGDGFDGLGIS